jgi:hypothetical protein
MSDGRPDIGDGRSEEEIEQIHAWLRQNNRQGKVVINCVAMGDYFGKTYAEFLQKIAYDSKGVFIGR